MKPYEHFKQEMENHQEEVHALTDAGIFGTGFVEVTYDIERECIVKKRVHPSQIKIDHAS